MTKNLSITSDTQKRKVSPADIRELEKRAKEFAAIGGATATERIHAQAWFAYGLSLDFHRYAVLGGDFPRWLSEITGVNRETCRQRYKMGRRLAERNEKAAKRPAVELLAEQRRVETTPRPDLEREW